MQNENQSTTKSETNVIPFKPVGANLFLIPFEESDKIGRIYIPETAKRPLNQGTVIKIGPEVHNCKVGDVVMYPLHMESRINYDRQTYYVLADGDLLGVCDYTDFIAATVK